MCDDNQSTYRTNAKKSWVRECAFAPYLYGFIILAFFGGMATGAFVVLEPSRNAAKPAHTCQDKFEWVSGGDNAPMVHTCEPGQKMDAVGDAKNIMMAPYIVCRCK